MTARVLVAGGTGRLGTLVVAALTVRGVPVRVLTRDVRRAAHLRDKGVEVVVGDVRDPDSIAAAVAGSDVTVSAVHGFAGPGGVSPTSIDRDGNITLIEAARDAGAEVVLMSVVGAAPDSPLELFRMKHAAEVALAASAVPGTVVRSTAFLELWIDLLGRSAGRSNRPVVLGRGNNPVNFVSVRDVAALLDRIIGDRTTRGHTFEIGGPTDLTLNQLADMVAKHRGRTTGPRHVPPPVLRTISATAGRLLPTLNRVLSTALVMDHHDMTSHNATARTQFTDLPSTSATELLPASADEKSAGAGHKTVTSRVDHGSSP